MKKASGLGIAIVGLVVGLFLLGSLLLMLLTNVVLHHYDVKTLDYGSAMAITALLSIFGGAVRTNDNK